MRRYVNSYMIDDLPCRPEMKKPHPKMGLNLRLSCLTIKVFLVNIPVHTAASTVDNSG